MNELASPTLGRMAAERSWPRRVPAAESAVRKGRGYVGWIPAGAGTSLDCRFGGNDTLVSSVGSRVAAVWLAWCGLGAARWLDIPGKMKLEVIFSLFIFLFLIGLRKTKGYRGGL